MAIIYVSSMDHYGAVADVELAGGVDGAPLTALIGDAWSDYPKGAGTVFRSTGGTYRIAAPSWGARQGDYALIADSVTGVGGGGGSVTWDGSEGFKLVIPGAIQHERLIHFAFSIDALPTVDIAHGQLCTFLDSNGVIRGGLNITPTGRLQIFDGDPLTIPANGTDYTALPTAVLTSASPVIEAETWYYLSLKIVTNDIDANADITAYLGDTSAANLVLSGTGIALTDTGSNKIAALGVLPISAGIALSGSGGFTNVDTTTRAVRDFVLCDNTGSYNNTLLGQCFVSAQELRDEDSGGGWTAYPRQKIETGVLDHASATTGLRFSDSASLEIGAADFTWEAFVRFDDVPSGASPTQAALLMSKWRAAAGARGYQFYYDGTDQTLVFQCSTTGANVVEVKRVPWVPLTDRYYHVAVVRSSGQLLFFIDGVQLGVPVTDSNTYYDSTAYYGIGVAFDAAGAPDPLDQFHGWLDEVRFTIGTARYTSDFPVPTAAFGRDVAGDAAFANVVLLLGFEGTIADESSYARPVTLNSSDPVAAIIPGDGDKSYRVLNQRPAWDDTYIEAALLPAEGLLTFDALPSAAETVTLGTQTYTWVSALSAADDILIGATIADTIANFIAAVNGGAGEGTVYGTGTSANTDLYALEFLSPQVTVRALTAGAAGNSIVTTETMADGYFAAATLTGGQDIPDDSQFALERLPKEATGVLGIQVTARTYKTDAGSATIEFDLIGPQTNVAAGTPATPDLSPAWTRQVFEEDPDTAAAPTVSTINTGRIRVKRPT